MALSPVLWRLQRLRVVLASASPRRQEILSNTGLRFEVVPSKFKETLSKASFPNPYAYAVETAKQKALEVAHRMYQKDLRTPDIVIGADTIVAVEDSILEKPVDKQDAYRMLSRLSGKEHSVFTGVAILRCCSSGGELQMDVSEFYEETKVTFSELSEELLWEYIHSGEPMDKAGGYGIQALGGMLVEQVHGDFLNVVGFPLNRFCKVMAALYPACPASAQLDSIPAVDTFDGFSDQEGIEPKTSMDRSLGEPRCGEPMPRSDSGPKHAQDLHGTDGDMQPATLDSLLQLIDGFKASKALFTACKLHVFDVLRDGVPHTPAEVAGKVDASMCGTKRLLDACTGLGLLHRSELGYTNSEVASTYLVSEGEDSLLGHVLHSDDCAWAAFTHLESAMLCMEPRGHPVQAPHAHGLEQLSCLRASHELTKLTAHSVVTAFDLSRFRTACHVGGCTGALAWELAREFPHMHVTVVDVPAVIEHARDFQPPWGDTERVSFVPGDVFRDILPEAELYILSPLHQDWPQDKVHQLLQRVSDACEPGRGLLLAATAPVEELGSPHSLRQTLDLLLRVEESQLGVGRCRLLELGFRDVQLVSCEDSVDVTLCLGRKVTPP